MTFFLLDVSMSFFNEMQILALLSKCTISF